MLAEPAQQLRLLDLVEIDTQISQRHHRSSSLPQHDQLAELRTSHREVAEQEVGAATALSDAQDALTRVESDLEPARQRLDRNQRRVDAGEVNDPKALRSMLQEIEHLKGRISDLEDADLEAMQAVEDAGALRDRLTASRAGIEAQARELMRTRDEALAVLDAELSDLAAERAIVAGGLDAALLTLYDKLRERTGVGAGKLEARRCTACGLGINQVALDRFLAAPPDEVLRCEECDRILVRVG